MEQLVQLLLEALHHLVHHIFDALHGGGDVLALHLLILQLGIGPKDLQGSGEVIAQKAVELRRLLGVAALVLKHLGGDDADAVDLLAELGIVDLTVDGPDLLKHRSLGILLCGRFFGGLRLRGGRIGQPLAGEHQAVVSVVQIPQGEQAVVQHIGQLIPHLGGGGPQGGGEGTDGDHSTGAQHRQVFPAAPHLVPLPQAHPQAAQTAEKEAQDGKGGFQIPGHVREHPQAARQSGNRGEAENQAQDPADHGKTSGLDGQPGEDLAGDRRRGGALPGGPVLDRTGPHRAILLGIVGVLPPDIGFFAAPAQQLYNDHQDADRGEKEQEEDRGDPETTVTGARVLAGRAAGRAILIEIMLHNH